MQIHTHESLAAVHGLSAPRPRRRQPLMLAVLDWLVERDRTYREHYRLLELSDHELADIGLTRGQVEWSLRKGGQTWNF